VRPEHVGVIFAFSYALVIIAIALAIYVEEAR